MTLKVWVYFQEPKDYSMKISHYVFIASSALFFLTACNKDQDVQEFPNEPSLIGVWSLIKSSGGFSGKLCEFDKNVVTWTFSEEDLVMFAPDTLSNYSGCAVMIGENTRSWALIEEGDDTYFEYNGHSWGKLTFIDNNSIFIDGRYHPNGGIGDDYFNLNFER